MIEFYIDSGQQSTTEKSSEGGGGLIRAWACRPRSSVTDPICVRPLPLHTLPTLHYGPRPLNSTRRLELFLNSTCDISLSDMRYGGKKDSDVRHGYFLNSTCDIAIFLNRYTTSGPPSRAPTHPPPHPCLLLGEGTHCFKVATCM